MARWRMRRGAGEHTLADGTTVRPGDTLECRREDLGSATDKFELVEDDRPPEQRAKRYIIPRGGGDLDGYDVVSGVTGEPINARPLTKAEAEELASTGV